MKYSDFIKTTDLSNHNLQFYLDGQHEEEGEVSGVFKRIRRGDFGEVAKHAIDDNARGIRWVIMNFPKIRLAVLKEIGDMHWYTSRFLQEINSTWEEAEELNMKKLQKRVETDKIMGKGDERENDGS